MITDAVGQVVKVGDVVVTYNKGCSGFDTPVRILKFSPSKKSYATKDYDDPSWSGNWEPLKKCVKLDMEIVDD